MPHSVGTSCEQEPTPVLPNPPQDLLGSYVPGLEIQVILSKAASPRDHLPQAPEEGCDQRVQSRAEAQGCALPQLQPLLL